MSTRKLLGLWLLAMVQAHAAGYRFAPEGSAVHELLISPERAGSVQLTWPDVPRPSWDTALLGIEVQATPGKLPWIDVTLGRQHSGEQLDPAAHGLRWLNLSGLRPGLDPGARVRLTLHGLKLLGHAATLRLFANPLDPGARLLVIAPHPDDAEIAAFGLYASRTASVVTLTSGNAGDMNYADNVADRAAHYQLKGLLRAYDSVTVPWLGGVDPGRTANLGYFDGELDALWQTPSQILPELYGTNTDVSVYRHYNLSNFVPTTPRGNSWRNLIEDLAAVLRAVQPAVIVMPDPRLDSHKDHQFAAVAVLEALDQWGGSPRFLLYTNHADANLYPYGPAGGPVSPPVPAGDLGVQGFYSFPLDAAMQTRKLFALEAMHDLRLAPHEQVVCETRAARWRPDYPRRPDVDYFRRAQRANELFLAYDTAGARAVVDEFLAQRR